MRRWLWPYAIMAIVLTVLGLAAMVYTVAGVGVDRAGAQIALANAHVIQPAKQFLVGMIDMVAPVGLPDWFKQVFAVLVLIAVIGLALSLALGLLLMPVFYALYRGAERD